MSGGLQQQWGVGDPAQPGSDAQSQEFKAAFEGAMGAIAANLQYTAANGERERHAPLSERSQALTPKYQGALAQIDPTNPAKAKPAIDSLLAETRAVGQDVATFRAETEEAFTQWQSRSAAYDTAVTQVEELSEWQHPKEAAVRSLADAVRDAVNARAYKKAVAVLDQFLPKLQPIYEDMQTQKAAQKEYEPAQAALQPRLAAAATPGFAKLASQQSELAPAAAAMEASAQARDFVAALAASSALATKVDAYEKAVDELTRLKQEYDTAAAQTQSRLQAAPNPSPFNKLGAQQAELLSGQQAMEASAQGEEFQQGIQQANELGTKADAYTMAVEQFSQLKQQYDQAAAQVQPKLQAAPNPSPFNKLAAQQAELASGQQTMETAAQGEEFEQALQAANDVGGKVDAYAAAVEQMTQAKQDYDKASGLALQAMQSAPSPSPFQKFAAQQVELTTVQQAMEAAAQGEEFEQAVQQANDLNTKAEAYAAAVADMQKAKQAYDEAAAPIMAKLQAAPSPSPFQKLAAQQAELATAQQAMEAAAQGEDFPQALQQATDLGGKVDAYMSAVDVLAKAKEAYEQGSVPVLQRVKAAPNPSPYPKFAPQQAELVSSQQTVEAAVAGEDYEQAQARLGELATKVDAYVAALADQDEKKTSYLNALAGVQPLLDQATQSQVREAAGVQKELQALRAQMEAAATGGDYVQALKLVEDVKNKADEVMAVTSSSGVSTKFSFDVAPKNPIADGKPLPYTKGKATLKLEVSGEISGTGASNKVKAGTTGLPGSGNEGFKGEIEIFKTKFAEGVAGTQFTEAKGSIGFELSLKKVDINVGVSFKVQTGWSWLAGVGGVKFKFAEADWKKLQADKPPTVASLEFSAGLQGEGVLKGSDVGLAEGYEIKVNVKGTITAAFTPDWAEIFGEVGKKIAEEGAKEVATDAAGTVAEGTAEGVGEGAVAVVTGEVVIAGAIIIAGVATIAGGIFTVVRGWAIGDLSQSYTPSVEAAKAGFRAGMSNGSAPGDQFGATGFAQGRRNFQALVDRTKQEHPEATDEAIAKAIVAKADEALAQMASAIDRAVREGMWYGYIGQHTTLLLGDEARWGYVACFGNEPDSNSPDAAWKAYMVQHPMQSKASPK